MKKLKLIKLITLFGIVGLTYLGAPVYANSDVFLSSTSVFPTPIPEPRVLKIVKFNDRNANSQRDAGEEGLIWRFRIRQGASVSEVITDADGVYTQWVPSDLTYTIEEFTVSGWKATRGESQTVFVPNIGLSSGSNAPVEVVFGNVQTPVVNTPDSSSQSFTITNISNTNNNNNNNVQNQTVNIL